MVTGMKDYHIWMKVRGPIANLMVSLHRIDLKTPSQSHWISYDELGPLHHIFFGMGCSADLLQAIQQAVLKSMAKNINAAWSGESDGLLPDFPDAAKHIRKLRSEEKFEDAATLQLIATGAGWPNDRRLKRGLQICNNGICMRCGASN